jgi:hypothetical protein
MNFSPFISNSNETREFLRREKSVCSTTNDLVGNLLISILIAKQKSMCLNGPINELEKNTSNTLDDNGMVPLACDRRWVNAKHTHDAFD